MDAFAAVRSFLPKRAVLILAASLAILSSTPRQALAAELPDGFEDVLVAGGLTTPTSMAFMPGDRLLVAERRGTLRVIKDGQLLPSPFVTIEVDEEAEQGLLGIAVDPDFSSNGHIYVYYSTPTTPSHNRVSRFTADIAAGGDTAIAGSEVVMLDNIVGGSLYHNGGGMHFGNDGMLYIGIGDGHTSSNAQDLTILAGALLRLDVARYPEVIPDDNPDWGIDGARREIWATGLRNPFTFAVDPLTGKVHINDVGQGAWEEINLGVAGANYGWPTCEGACQAPNPAFTDPVHAYPHAGGGSAITGGVFYRGSAFPAEYEGDYFFADYLRGFIGRLRPDNSVVGFATGLTHNPVFGGPVDLAVGPDGALYYLWIGQRGSSTGEVRRIQFTGAGNMAPEAVAVADVLSGAAPLTVNFDGTGSSDPDEDPLTYSWDFGDSGEAVSGAQVQYTFTAAGQYTVTLTVDDGNGGADTDSLQVVAGFPPVAAITSPPDGTLYRGGQSFVVQGTGEDFEDGDLDASSFSWTVVFHQHDHTHEFIGPVTGVAELQFTVPVTGETAADVWYRAHLTVTDSTGITHTDSIDLLPVLATLALETDPPGLVLTLDRQPVTAPASVLGVAGIVREIGAPSSQMLGGDLYLFSGWSDDGARIHTVSFPESDEVVTASFTVVEPSPTPTPSPTAAPQQPSAPPQPAIPTPTPGPSAPSAPLDARAYAGRGEVLLEWSVPASDGGSPVTAYRILNVSSGQAILTGGQATSITVSGLSGGVEHLFQISAVNAAGHGPSALAGPVIPLPAITSGALVEQDQETLQALDAAAKEIFGNRVVVSGEPVTLLSYDGQVEALVRVSGLPGGSSQRFAALTVDAGQLQISAGPDGEGFASLQLGVGMSISGTAQVRWGVSELSVLFTEPVLQYVPSGEGMPQISFASTVNRWPEDASLSTSTGLYALEAAAPQLEESFSAMGWQPPDVVEDVWQPVSVAQTGFEKGDLGETAVIFGIGEDWYAAAQADGRMIVAGKLSDDGQLFLAPAECAAENGFFSCAATFSGDAAGFSTFFLATALPMEATVPTPSPATQIPAPTPTTAQQTAVASATVTSSPTTAPSPGPTTALGAPTPSALPAPTVISVFEGSSDTVPETGLANFPPWGWIVAGTLGLIALRGVVALVRR